MTELERLRHEVALLEPLAKLIERGLTSANHERHLARQVLIELRNLRCDRPARQVVRHV